MMKKVVVVAFLLAAVGTGTISCKKGGKDPQTNEQKSLYSMGVIFGQRVKNLNLKEEELDFLFQGFRVGALGEKEKVKLEEVQGIMQEFIKKKMEEGSEIQKKEGEKFMEKFLKDGGQKTASGLGYKISEPGNGKQPLATDIVKVHYHGTLMDGTVFDSSKERGQPASFPLNRVIKGWTEGVQMFKEGGKMKLVVPADLGYGVQGAPPKIPGGATLVFDIELIGIENPPAAAAAPAAQTAGKEGKSKKH